MRSIRHQKLLFEATQDGNLISVKIIHNVGRGILDDEFYNGFKTLSDCGDFYELTYDEYIAVII